MTFISKNVPTEWVDYTPEWTNTSSTTLGNGLLAGRWRKVGDTLEIKILLSWGSGTSSSGTSWRFSIPSGFTIDYTKTSPLSVTGDFVALGGTIMALDDSTNTSTRVVIPVSDAVGSVLGSLNLLAGFVTASGSIILTQSSPFTWTTNDRLDYHVFVPVNE